jgi:hypothetical protein
MTTSLPKLGSATDALMRETALAHHLELPVLGISTHFETNSRDVFELLEESFGRWRGIDGVDASHSLSPLRVRVVVHEGREHGAAHRADVRVRHRWFDAKRLLIKSTGSSALSDPARRGAVAYVSTELLASREYFRTEVLDAITLALLSHFDRHPVHAAAIAHDDHAILLAAPSGTGKSTLAYLAHRAGLDVLSEDHVWIQRQEALRVWGWPSRIRLLAHSVARFPELANLTTSSVRGGKEKLAIDVTGPASVSARSAVLCLLERGQGRVSLERVGATQLVDRLTKEVAPGFDRFPERHRDTIAALAAPGGWRLRLSSDPSEALPFLLRMLGEARDAASPPAPRSSSANRT